MIDRLEILVSRTRRLVSRNRWTARLLGAPPVVGHADEPGLVLIQVDGLGEAVLERALREGKMPFVQHLLEDEGYAAHRLYSGLPSNTPAFQAELFWGVPGAVPGFGFRDRATGGEVWMTQRPAAAALEARLEAEAPGLLRGGSAWSDIYAGGAAEPRFCSATAGVSDLLRALTPTRLVGLVLWHGWSVVRVLANLVAETGLALADFARGTIAGRDLRTELRFVGERVAVTAVLREIVTAGASVDADRGLPVVHLNLLGYDEHAHRRGPDSRFALWTLKGIDRTIRRVWLAAHRSRHRDYQVWIYSDHGQENVEPYRRVYGEEVHDAIRRVWAAWKEGRTETAVAAAALDRRISHVHGKERAERTRPMREELPEWMRGRAARHAAEPAAPPPPPEGEPLIVHRGTIGFVYLPGDWDPAERAAFAARVAREVRVPTVLVRDGDGALAFPATGGELRIPGDEARLVGADHPHRDEIARDLLRMVHHEDAGDLVLLSWSPDRPLAFNLVNGAHGGPGPRETTTFLVTPPETSGAVPGPRLRAADLRELARDVLDPARANLRRRAHAESRAGGSRELRVVTYNVHGCRGMDGRYSVERVSRAIARLAPDVACLQELDLERVRSGGTDQGHEIAWRLEAEHFSHAVREADDGPFGNAVLTSCPLRLVATGPLPAIQTRLDLEPRGVLWVELEIGGTRIQVLNTHLSIIERERRLQVEELLSASWLGHPECTGPVILTGDLNAATDSWVCRRLAERLPNVVDLDADARRAGRPILSTWSGRVPVRRIDHVFASPHFRVRRCDVPRNRLTRVASDHLPLVVDLALVD